MFEQVEQRAELGLWQIEVITPWLWADDFAEWIHQGLPPAPISASVDWLINQPGWPGLPAKCAGAPIHLSAQASPQVGKQTNGAQRRTGQVNRAEQGHRGILLTPRLPSSSRGIGKLKEM